MLNSAHFVFALSLLFLTHEAAAGIAPHGSFSRGFSSHASSSHVSVPHLTPAAPRSSFGSFGSRSTAAAPAQAQKSDSALSQQLSKNAAQANALRTLDERDAARAAQNSPQPAPGYAQSAPVQPASAPAPAPTTVVVHQDSGGLGHVLAGAMIARSMNAHAHAGYYPGPNYNGGGPAAQNQGGASFFSLFLTLCLLAVIGWGLWFAWKGVRRRRAALREANKQNYSFERN